MALLIFLLGGAFGMSLSSLCLSVEALYKEGLTEDTLIDIVHELASITLIVTIAHVYVQLA